MLNDAHNVYWTYTAWQDEAALKAFIVGRPHLHAMKKLPYWCDEAAVVHWAQEGTSMPDWKEVHRKLKADGRPSKLMYPSPAHQAFEIPAPRG